MLKIYGDLLFCCKIAIVIVHKIQCFVFLHMDAQIYGMLSVHLYDILKWLNKGYNMKFCSCMCINWNACVVPGYSCLRASRMAKPSTLVPDLFRLFIETLQRDDVCERSFLIYTLSPIRKFCSCLHVYNLLFNCCP